MQQLRGDPQEGGEEKNKLQPIQSNDEAPGGTRPRPVLRSATSRRGLEWEEDLAASAQLEEQADAHRNKARLKRAAAKDIRSVNPGIEQAQRQAIGDASHGQIAAAARILDGMGDLATEVVERANPSAGGVLKVLKGGASTLGSALASDDSDAMEQSARTAHKGAKEVSKSDLLSKDAKDLMRNELKPADRALGAYDVIDGVQNGDALRVVKGSSSLLQTFDKLEAAQPVLKATGKVAKGIGSAKQIKRGLRELQEMEEIKQSSRAEIAKGRIESQARKIELKAKEDERKAEAAKERAEALQKKASETRVRP